ncbi:FG-GAP-like repeat-containing protein [Calditrichota bacterium]
MFRILLIITIFYFNLSVGIASKDAHQFTSLFFKSTEKVLIPDINDGYGVAFRDINNDNLPDIYLVCFRGLNRLLINPGNGKSFLDATIESGLGGNLMPLKIFNLELGSAVADFDNDNDPDVLIVGWGNSTSFFRNEGNLQFDIHTRRLDINFPKDFNTAIAGDINNDGDLDIYLTDEHYTNRLLLNEGNSIFKDITRISGLEFNGVSQGAAFCDIDNDGDLDLYVTNWFDRDIFYKNIGGSKFVSAGMDIEVCVNKINTNAVSFADLDNDGDFDFFVTNRQGRNYLYLNNTQEGDSLWQFSEVSREASLIDSSVSYGSVIADFNNDGWQDIFVTNIGPNQFYINKKNGTFQKVYEDSFSKKSQTKGYSTGAAYADYDQDGDLDLFVANKDTFCLLYTNGTNNNSFIKFDVHGISSNYDAIGTRVELYKRGKIGDKQYLLGSREISGGSGYLSTNELVVHFGLDTVKIVDARFIFPSGEVVDQTKLLAGKLYEIDEYSPLLTTAFLSFQYLRHMILKPFFVNQLILVLLFIAFAVIFIRLGLNRYQWNPKTATTYMTGFFLLVLIVITSMKELDLLQILVVIDSLTVIFMIIFIINSERFRKLRLSRGKYRTVLIDLSNQLVKIHDDEQLIKSVTENIIKHTVYNQCCLLVIDEELKKITDLVSDGEKISNKEINGISILPIFINNLRDQFYIERKNNVKFDLIFSLLRADIIFSIRHNKDLYGMLSLGSQNTTIELSVEDKALYGSLTNQLAITLENNKYIRQSNEMVEKLTAAKVREKYLQELEQANTALDVKNQELQKLYDELKNTQAQLIQSEKMSSLGQLVAGISHELNNPIGYIYSNSNQLKNYINRIQEYISSAALQKELTEILPDIKNLIEDTVSGSQAVKELVDNLRRFSHLDQAKWQKVDLHESIESSLKILKSQLKNRIQVHKKYGIKNLVECNPGQINQVLLNILANAAQSIEDTGNIWIETKEENVYFVIEVRDDGKGMSKETLSKIFDPFFTTKDVGEGTGLGLSISYSIIKNHLGTIEAKSEMNKGSVFRIKLPQKRDHN